MFQKFIKYTLLLLVLVLLTVVGLIQSGGFLPEFQNDLSQQKKSDQSSWQNLIQAIYKPMSQSRKGNPSTITNTNPGQQALKGTPEAGKPDDKKK